MAEKIGPEYQRLIDLIKSKITSGEYPIGEPIPSTAKLHEQTGMSIPVVRRAVGQLQADGILQGQPGKAVYVRATPVDVASERMTIKTLSEQVSSLRAQMQEAADRETGGQDSGELLTTVGRIEANLIDLYGKLGFEYPQGGSRDGTKTAARRGRARG